MELPKIQNVNVFHKVVLLRLDLNVPIVNNMISDISRISAIKPTIEYLLKKSAKIVILSHLGRPKGKVKTSLSLLNILNTLEKEIKIKVIFSKEVYGDKVKNKIDNLKKGEILLLENIRFFKEEEENSKIFSKEISKNFDIFCNDAFSVSHRSHASTEGVTHFLSSYAGLLLQNEIKEIEKILKNPTKPIVALVGGAKVSTKMKLLSSLIKKIDHLIIGGGMANTFLNALGKNIGKSLCEFEMKKEALKIIELADLNNCKLYLPSDIVCSKKLSEASEPQSFDVEKCPDDLMILDSGEKTTNEIERVFNKCKTLIWNGPLGAFEIPPFDKSTLKVAKYAAKLTKDKQLKSIAGGGDTISALNKASVTDQFSYVSTSGGAFLEWLEDENLPGILALLKNNKT